LEPAFPNPKFRDYLLARGASADVQRAIIDGMTGLNAAIAEDTLNLGPGFRIGHSFFVPAESQSPNRSWFEQVIATEIRPLLEEYAAAEERLAFLSEQLEDVERTRRDLLEIVRQVDDRVQEVFAEAFADTAREFETVFARLFPGGEGRLVLTQPDDLLATGVEVEARPPGKRVKRLSLLSGGERSLVAVAFLVALFKARPSPFYVLDEVEAALDDVNLGRLLEIYEELRASSQLIVITHQKRTMEIADALYGASMRGDGVTAVISQRIREPQLA
jgi:chromosome segregation protein